MDFKNKNVAIIGVAKSGISSALLLYKLGANVFLYDAKPKEKLKPELFNEIDRI